MTMEYIIGRFEGEYAVCEDEKGNRINIKKKDIPKESKEGDIIILKDGTYYIDYEKTKKQKEKVESLRKSVMGEDL